MYFFVIVVCLHSCRVLAYLHSKIWTKCLEVCKATINKYFIGRVEAYVSDIVLYSVVGTRSLSILKKHSIQVIMIEIVSVALS